MSTEDRVDMPRSSTAAHNLQELSLAKRMLPLLQSAGLSFALIALVFFFSIKSDLFLTAQNLRNVGLQAAALAVVSCGQMIVILTSGLDLSVGATVALVSVITALAINRFGVPLGIFCGLMTCAGIGVINGVLI